LKIDKDILTLKAEGKSLRRIAAALGISHEAVRKRLKSIESKDRVSTKTREHELTPSTGVKEIVSTGANPHESRVPEESEVAVNLKTPSHIPAPGVNPPGKRSNKLPECRKGVFQGVLSEVDDLFEAIREFLETNGIEVYHMNVVQEAYQVKHKGQVIRFIYSENKMEAVRK
jgi:DNA-binding Lrp family transcriptional regulator